MNTEYIKPSDIEIIDIPESTWNCDKCIFFKPDECECDAIKRKLYSISLRDDCDDCKRPFVLKSEAMTILLRNNADKMKFLNLAKKMKV